ncbi:Thylakoid lumenal 15 kDa protein 1, chloroplastic [Linum perenne]
MDSSLPLLVRNTAIPLTFLQKLINEGGGPYGSEVTRGQDLTGKDFSGKTLIKQDFKTSILRQANFKSAKLLGASFFDADLTGADLSDADLRGVDFSLANVTKGESNHWKRYSRHFTLQLTTTPSMHDAGSAITGLIRKECADLWPRIASAVKAIS